MSGLKGSGQRGLLNTNELTEPGLRHRLANGSENEPSNSIIGAGSPIPAALTGQAADLAPLEAGPDGRIVFSFITFNFTAEAPSPATRHGAILVNLEAQVAEDEKLAGTFIGPIPPPEARRLARTGVHPGSRRLPAGEHLCERRQLSPRISVAERRGIELEVVRVHGHQIVGQARD